MGVTPLLLKHHLTSIYSFIINYHPYFSTETVHLSRMPGGCKKVVKKERKDYDARSDKTRKTKKKEKFYKKILFNIWLRSWTSEFVF